MEAKRGCLFLTNWSYRLLLSSIMCVLGIEPRSFGRLANVLTTEPSHQPKIQFLKTSHLGYRDDSVVKVFDVQI